MGILSLASLATLVFCAPGYPGSAGDAQPLVVQFANAAAAEAGWPAGSLTAVYDSSEAGGLDKLGQAEAVLAFVPYPFYVEHGGALHLTALVQADVADIGTSQRWTLVAKASHIATVQSTAGYAAEFVRHSALADWPMPADTKVEYTGQVLGALRKAAAGDPVAVLLDQQQAAALPSLPFGADLKNIAQSAPMPVALIALVGSRLPAERAHSLQAALLKMGQNPRDTESLGGLRLRGFILPKLPPRAPTP